MSILAGEENDRDLATFLKNEPSWYTRSEGWEAR